MVYNIYIYTLKTKGVLGMAKKGKDYFGFGRLVSIIFAIIPFTAWLFGIITRFKEGKPVAGIIRIFCGWFVWVCDLIMMIIKGSILRVLNC